MAETDAVGDQALKVRMFYLVQTFSGPEHDLVADPVRECECALEAEDLARALAHRHPAVLAYMIEGDPDSGVWGDPDFLAAYGLVNPQLRRAAG